MKLTIAGLLAVFLPIISPPVWEVAAGDSAKNADEQVLLDVEYQWANAYVSRDAEKLASILSRDYVQTNTRARVTDKEEEVLDLRKGTFRYEKFETTQMKVRSDRGQRNGRGVRKNDRRSHADDGHVRPPRREMAGRCEPDDACAGPTPCGAVIAHGATGKEGRR